MAEIERPTGMLPVTRDEWRWVLVASVLVVAFAALPYAVNYLRTPPGYAYTGLVVNAYDGNSYLAKMRQGFDGSWLFTLPFTPDPQRPSLLFTYYLLLGHIARVLGLPLVLTFHLARSVGGLALLFVAYRLISECLVEVGWRRLAFGMAALSSGLGWLAAPFGVAAPDLWVPEANTFFSLFVNPHFPLAEALMYVAALSVVSAPDAGLSAVRLTLLALTSVALCLVQPLAPFVLFPVLAAYWLLAPCRPRGLWLRLAALGLAAAPLLAYYAAVFTRNSTIAAWTAQNSTPTPAPWLMLIGFGLLLPFGLVGAAIAIRERRCLLPVVWLGVTGALLYAPFALQRRMTMGVHLPLVILATLALSRLLPGLPRRPALQAVIVGLPALTTLLLVLGSGGQSSRHEWPLFMTDAERAAMRWLSEQTDKEDIVLADARAGLLIPAWAGNRVVYGHPFETLDAENRRAEVQGFFSTMEPDFDLLRRYGVRYVFARRKGTPPPSRLETDPRLSVAFSDAGVTLFRVEEGSEK